MCRVSNIIPHTIKIINSNTTNTKPKTTQQQKLIMFKNSELHGTGYYVCVAYMLRDMSASKSTHLLKNVRKISMTKSPKSIHNPLTLSFIIICSVALKLLHVDRQQMHCCNFLL
jgi:hypothetical protein